MNSFWYNEYSHIDPESLQGEKKILFEYFLKTATNAFEKYLGSVHGNDSTTAGQTKKQLESVYAFFEAENFRGFVLKATLDVTTAERTDLYEFEAYFQTLQANNIHVVDETGKIIPFTSDQKINSIFIQNIIQLQVNYI